MRALLGGLGLVLWGQEGERELSGGLVGAAPATAPSWLLLIQSPAQTPRRTRSYWPGHWQVQPGRPAHVAPAHIPQSQNEGAGGGVGTGLRSAG